MEPSLTLARLAAPRPLEPSACCPICTSDELMRLGGTVVEPDHMACAVGLVPPGQALHYDLCAACRFVFLNPRYSEESLAEYYADVCPLNEASTQPADRSTNERYKRRERERFSRLFRLLSRQVTSIASVVDVGSLDGASLIPFARAGCRVYAVEPGWDARTPDLTGVPVFESIDKFASEGPKVDCLLSTQTFEHLRNPTVFATQCSKVLTKGGAMLIEVPYDLLQMVGLWTAEEVTFGHPEHINFFSRHSLRSVANQAGLEVRSVMLGVQIHKFGGLIPSLSLIALVPPKRSSPERIPPSPEPLLTELERDARYIKRIQRRYQLVGMTKGLGRW